MNAKNRRVVDPGIDPDPYGENAGMRHRADFSVLGGRFRFESDSHELLELAQAAYGRLPNQRFATKPRTFHIKLMLTPRDPGGVRRAGRRSQPPPIAMLNGAGFLGSATPSSTFVVLSPKERAGLVAVSAEMLKFPYHVRYEAIEFAVFTLACRAQALVPLHAACVGIGGCGILLMGPSGAGKSTVALQSLIEGFHFLSEDSVFVEPRSMRATGTANFLHVRADSLHWLGRSRIRSIIRASPVIRRRSGVEKFEVDLRRKEFRLAQAPLKIAGVVFLSPKRSANGPLLRRLSRSEATSRLHQEQAYGESLPQWRGFRRNLLRLGAFELTRGKHPSASTLALRSLLASA
jgi:hypothetical protein